MSTSILWFRRDLRVHNNAALQWVCEHSDTVIAVYIHAPDEEAPWQPGGASRWWLHQSLNKLSQKLNERGIQLNILEGSTLNVLSQIYKDTGATHLVFNKLYEPQILKRDDTISHQLGADIAIKSFHSNVIFAPGSILNKQQLPYRVFTPFYKQVRPHLVPSYEEISRADTAYNFERLSSVSLQQTKTIDALNLLDIHSWHDKLHQHWTTGEDEAHNILDCFITQTLDTYISDRDIPSLKGTSSLSPYLHFGEITPRHIIRKLWPLIEGSQSEKVAAAAEAFIRQLVWREFAVHILWHYPDTALKPMNEKYADRFWAQNNDHLSAWQKGKTGIQLIDAGMNELWQTGWMHNRIRMLTGSFLSKNLNIHWLNGAQWFWDTLVDANLANNSMGWQWVSGCGVDAAPYYRIFNPDTQVKRFDPKHEYINRWNSNDFFTVQSTPIVDLKQSREQALIRYQDNIKIL